MKLKRILVVSLSLLMVIGVLSGCSNGTETPEAPPAEGNETNEGSGLEETNVFDAARFPQWFEEEGTWRTIENARPDDDYPGGFVTDESGRPSQEELETMLHMSSLAVTSGGKSDWYMVAVTDPEEQLEIIGDNYGVATSEGTVTVLVFSERLLREDVRTDDYNTFQPDRGYYNAGIVTGYLNVAAISQGYGTHMFMTPDLPGENGFNDGDIGLDATKYIEGTEYFSAATNESFSNENMKFVCAVVIGTLDESVEAGVTQKEFPDNWTIWDE